MNKAALFAFVFIACLGLAACAAPATSVEGSLLRARVVRLWTDQEMIDDWEEHLRPLAGTPPLETYLRKYRRETVFLGYAGRGERYEYALAASAMRLAPDDIVDLQVSARRASPLAFGDLSVVKKVVCDAADTECLDDATRGATLGPVGQ